MRSSYKINSLFACGVIVLFDWTFMFLKHATQFRDVIPFGDDPYDAIGSFAFLVGPMIALLALVRALRSQKAGNCAARDSVYLIRTQMAVILLILMTLACDAVAMARHPAMWISAPSRGELITLLAGATVIAGAMLWRLWVSARSLPANGTSRWKQAAVSVSAVLAVLAFYPEQRIADAAFHMFTVVAGAALLFGPMRPLLATLLPYEDGLREPLPRSISRRRWGSVLLIGIIVGVGALAGEMSEGTGAMPITRLAVVASMFVGLGTAGLLVAYACLAKSLGISQHC